MLYHFLEEVSISGPGWGEELSWSGFRNDGELGVDFLGVFLWVGFVVWAFFWGGRGGGEGKGGVSLLLFFCNFFVFVCLFVLDLPVASTV